MSQKTISINSKKFTAKEIEKQLTENNETEGGEYLVRINGQQYIADYYYNTDAYYIPDDIAPDGIYIREYHGGAFASNPVYLKL